MVIVIPRRCFIKSSYYVEKARIVDIWKQKDEALRGEWQRGRFLLMINRRPLMTRDAENNAAIRWSTHKELKTALAQIPFTIEDGVLLDAAPRQTGVEDSDVVVLAPMMALGLESPQASDAVLANIGKRLEAKFVDFRLAYIRSQLTDAGMLARAQSLLSWSRQNRFCAKCTKPLQYNIARTKAECTDCKKQYYPQVSPVPICLVRDIDDECLFLIQLPRSAPGVFTCVAGFTDTGESLEEACRREVAEEAGLDIISIKYLQMSSAWPFPSASLMCAYTATADRRVEFAIDRNELLDGDWFSRSEVQAAFDRTVANPLLKGEIPADARFHYIPPRGTMAFEMIKRWLAKQM